MPLIKFEAKDFLTNRKQRLVLTGKYSSWEDATADIPQESILGSAFVLSYINDQSFFADEKSLIFCI